MAQLRAEQGERWREVLSHSVGAHLGPMLDVLSPRGVVARFAEGVEQAIRLSAGRWKVFPMEGRSARLVDREKARAGLRALGLCGEARGG